jgi:hypothetical protein
MHGTATIKPSKWRPMASQSEIALTGRSYHISNGMKTGGVVSTVAAIGVFAREHGPGQYSIDQHYLDPFHGAGDISRIWGRAVHHPDGRVTIHIEPIPVPA